MKVLTLVTPPRSRIFALARCQCGMVGLVSRELEAEIGFHRRADVRRAAVVDGPAAVFILMAEDVVRALLEASGLPVPRSTCIRM